MHMTVLQGSLSTCCTAALAAGWRTCTTLLSLGLYKNVLQAFCPMNKSWLQSGIGPIASGAENSTALMRCSLQTRDERRHKLLLLAAVAAAG
jgi:hypothetical protein